VAREKASPIIFPARSWVRFFFCARKSFRKFCGPAKLGLATLIPFLTQCFDCPERYEMKFPKFPVNFGTPDAKPTRRCNSATRGRSLSGPGRNRQKCARRAFRCRGPACCVRCAHDNPRDTTSLVATANRLRCRVNFCAASVVRKPDRETDPSKRNAEPCNRPGCA
jgi:hypothetical protein